jgi:NAD(P)-dependent dehydrogenase (short-subunit alcohol dehydrogenase family)
MPTVLIAGASRGIGLELARQYAKAGWRVHATTRNPQNPGALGQVPGEVVLHELEVRDAQQIANLSAVVQDESIDVLIHNAGVPDEDLPAEEVMKINAEAPLHVTAALLPALGRGTQKKVVLMTSQLGARRGSVRSLGTYGNSKAALNDAFRERAPEWAGKGLIAIVVHPGWVRTDMGGSSAPLPVEESVAGIIELVDRLTPAEHGRFWTWDGREHPW